MSKCLTLVKQHIYTIWVKSLRWFLFFLIIALFLPANGWAQHPLLNNFIGFQQDKNIHLSWTFTSGSQCNGTRIFRSNDGERFEEIGRIPGICGASDTPVTYSFTDSLPFPNTINYYRLELGNQGFSTAFAIDYYVPGEDGYSVITSELGVEVLVDKPPARKGVAQIFDIRGSMVDEFEFTSRRIPLMQKKGRTGMYIFRLVYENGAVLSGKFVNVI